MTKRQTFLNRACSELHLTIVAPFALNLRGDAQIKALALLPELGGPKGMVIVTQFKDLLNLGSELVHAGYGYSVLDELDPSDEFDLDSYIEMFSDWGWGDVNERRPDWMKEQLPPTE